MADYRVTYRELRNTPGRVYERLAAGEPLTLMADGEAKAILIPVDNGDATATLDAWRRGRALLLLASMQADARRNGTSSMTMAEIDEEIRETRKERRMREG